MNGTYQNIDCMELMANLKDKEIDLAIVDPPYGIDIANMNMGLGKSPRCSKIENRKWTPKNWDKEKPSQEYFNELFRVSKRQIIFGGNYFNLPTSQYFLIWDKGEGLYGRSFAECEYAWVSEGGTRIFKINPVQKDRIHETQKPVELYKNIIKFYAKKGWIILDTHVGSASSLIAFEDEGLEYVASEKDKDHYSESLKRLKDHLSQGKLFQRLGRDEIKISQPSMFA